MGAIIHLDDFLGLYRDEIDQTERERYTRSHMSEEPLIPNVYEPIEEDELYRARSASPRLESGTALSVELCIEYAREPYSIRENPELVKTNGQPRNLENRAKPTYPTQLSHRFQGNRDINNQTNRTSTKKRPKDGYLGQQRPNTDWRPTKPQSRQSSWENWIDAGDRLFGNSSRTRQ
ncbi:hypothetical protein AK830_g11903 [Neonectria ditissima]|uniref:Uncharacterized protein n=1 Tax=Neonectria ditissima TaxID=78410 RepID=A0A0P7AL45_9HYPO|nr:hypothetical protein AK830_g11903 [Neonectria ditissima]